MGKKVTNPIVKAFIFLGGFQVAIVCMVLLLILTWLSTLEQTGPGGLYWTLDKYFSFGAYFVQPNLYGNDLPIYLPGGYWVCVIFTLNLFIGGIMRLRKGWRYAPVLVSHFSMLMLMVGGAVTYHQSREALMSLKVGDTSDWASSLTELSLEIAVIANGEKQMPFVISSDLLSSVRGKPQLERDFLLPKLPFDITISNFEKNSQLTYHRPGLIVEQPVVDGFYALPIEPTGHEEKNLSSCLLTITERESGEIHKLILHEGVTHDVTVTIQNKLYGFSLNGEIWNTPFMVRLDESRGEKHPGTGTPMTYESDVTVIGEDGNDERKFKIEMNKPLRYNNLTFYQTSWDDSGSVVKSGFTVKTNPSDQWPKYAIYACGIALFMHFTAKLFGFVSHSIARSRK